MKILVVDDNADSADMMAMLLETLGHTVFVEYTPEGALRRAQAGIFDAVISDIGLPIIDGYQLCRQMKIIPHLIDTVFIALTGYGDANDQKNSKEAGFNYHWVKPVSLATLASL